MTTHHFTVTTKHPTGYNDGEHDFTVTTTDDGFRYASSPKFGTSRNYNVRTDYEAMSLLLKDHATEIVDYRWRNER